MSLPSLVSPICAAALTLGVLAQPVAAQDTAAPTGNFVLELNNATDTQTGGCQLTFVSVNESEDALSAVTFQAGIFDGGGIVTQLVLFEFGGLPAGKTLIVPFTLPSQSCADISRIIVNAVAECTTVDGAASDLCDAGLVTRSLSGIAFSS